MPARPDVSVVNRVAMILELDRPSDRCLRADPGCSRGAVDFRVVMDENSIVFHGHNGIFDLLSCLIKFGSFKIHIVGLPNQWWKTHVHGWFVLGVNAAAFIVLSL